MGIEGDDAEHVRLGALLHDIGKIGVDLAVLRKPGRLDEAEEERVRAHPGMGASILERVLPAAIVECAAAHHEQPDGKGYPRGLRGEDIAVGALICRVADVLDALTTAQAYRAALTLDEALGELRDGAGTRYAPAVVEALCRLVERRGVGLAA
jgi:HD-GYP domain-containing protein (c-di-GMP phosphodiesterase class II)